MKFKSERELQKNKLLKDGEYKSTKEAIERVARLMPFNNLFAELDRDKNIIFHTARDFLKDVEAVGDGLLSLGLLGKHIAIIAENSYRYVVCDMAISGGVGVVCPIDKDANEELTTLLLNKCDANVIICSSFEIRKIEKILPSLPKIEKIITIDNEVEGYTSLTSVMDIGYTLKDKKAYRNIQLDYDAPAKILFTSGTTGANKPVMLSQNNLSANMVNCMLTMFGPVNKEKNTSMSVLPMHHATEINTHILTRIACGRLTFINDQMKNLMINIKVFKPYVITVVPMIANAIYKQIWLNAKKAGKDEKLKKGIKLSNFLRKFGIDITHRLFKEIYKPFGGNLYQIVCGGAMLNGEVVKGLNDLGIKVVNGYGISECGPLVSLNVDTLRYPNSVGKPCKHVSVKLSDVDEQGVGELCISGKSLSKGYYKDADGTKKVFDGDGFFHTGDLARIDENGNIFLTGRKKNVIILENGKNVCPEEIENEIENSFDYVKDAVVYAYDQLIGKELKQIICVGLYVEDKTIREDKERLQRDFRELNRRLPPYKRVNCLNLVDSEYEKTSTKKIKRDIVLKRHKAENCIII